MHPLLQHPNYATGQLELWEGGGGVPTNAVQIIPQLFVEIEKLSDFCLNNNMNNCSSTGISWDVEEQPPHPTLPPFY